MYKYLFVAQCLIIQLFFCGCNNTGSKSTIETDSVSTPSIADTTVVNDTNNPGKLPATPDSIIGLIVKVSKSDTFDIESDAEYGVGDDDMFTANDFKVYKLSGGQYVNVSKKLNDYNLTTSLKNIFIDGQPDTFIVVINFPGLSAGKKQDTNIIVRNLDFFNGNRKSLSDWKNGGTIKDVAISFNGKPLGTVQLENTFKLQTIDLSSHPLYNIRGNSDTLRLIVQSIYPVAQQHTYYWSEIKLTGERLY